MNAHLEKQNVLSLIKVLIINVTKNDTLTFECGHLKMNAEMSVHFSHH